LIANTNVFCFAHPTYKQTIPKRLLHPRRIFEGVRLGVEHGGNKSGVPTVNGALVFDDRFLGKPLVYCGTVGIMPSTILGNPSHQKQIKPGDLIIAAGGRTGKDGIHGATFSSEALHADSPSSAVQIGDPFTQKKLHDFLLEARDAGLYRTLTDNGAGGFSSSIGELAILSGGCEIHLEQALLKYSGLAPWEILLSESQERMTLAVSEDKFSELQDLAQQHEVDLSCLGTFTDTGKFHVFYHDKTVGLLSMGFLHEGVPELQLEARWEPKDFSPLSLEISADYGCDLHGLLAQYNICSKESIIRQYDHEVQGSTILKPLVGVKLDSPADAAIIRPIELMQDTEESGAICIANGICPRYSDFDAFHMAACAIDEAIRNLVAVGCDPSYIAILDNFCWPDPIYDRLKTTDGKLKLAQLVRACKALYLYATSFGTPIISGKDSMKNDYKDGLVKISIPPTLLISAIGKIHAVETAVSSDTKASGDLIYLIGLTANELGGSEYAGMKQLTGGIPPMVDAAIAKQSYHAFYRAIQRRLPASCHDCSDGGLAVALAEKAFGGGMGMEIDLSRVPVKGVLTDPEILFSESASRLIATVSPHAAAEFEEIFAGCQCKQIGSVSSHSRLAIRGLQGNLIMDEDIHALKESWQSPLRRK
jgi:phosphoribosylformylglycinamidine synthase II